MRATLWKYTNTWTIDKSAYHRFINMSLVKLRNDFVRVLCLEIWWIDSRSFDFQFSITNHKLNYLFWYLLKIIRIFAYRRATKKLDGITWHQVFLEFCPNSSDTRIWHDNQLSSPWFCKVLWSFYSYAFHLLCKPGYNWCTHCFHSHKETNILLTVSHDHLYNISKKFTHGSIN